MIYTTKRFSVGDAATGFGIGVSAGTILGDKIEGGIKRSLITSSTIIINSWPNSKKKKRK